MHAIEESDAAVGRYLSKIERKRVLQLLLANDIRFDSFEELLNLVKNLDEKDFSRLIRESKLTPDLELDLIIRAVRKLGNSAVHEMFSSLNYVPTREELIRIMKEVGKLIFEQKQKKREDSWFSFQFLKKYLFVIQVLSTKL